MILDGPKYVTLNPYVKSAFFVLLGFNATCYKCGVG